MRLYSRKSSLSRPALPLAVIKAINRSVNQTDLSGARVDKPKRRSTEFLKNENQPLLDIFSNKQRFSFNPENKYLIHPEQLWLIESVIGTQAYRKALSIKREIVVNDQFIEELFAEAPFSFYLSADEAYLLSSDDELTQLDFGPLVKISTLRALQRFGLVALERAKEKTAVRL